MIEARDITFKYGRQLILKKINISFDKGLHLIKGPNGSGKTTLCKVLSGLLRPFKGEVYIDGVDIYREGNRDILSKIIYVHDKPIILNRSVYENIIFGAEIKNLDVSDIQYLINRFRLENILDINALELSAGYKQLISILRALTVKPRYLILDEPFSGLDDEYREEVIDYIIRYSNKNTVLIATHTPYLDREASTITYLNNGEIKKRVYRELNN
ncbi:MAG TPA: ABC transporter ATP-binding protein [Thermoprotei archaeon]|nr:ABC transporter ATP-binding protein [Thermoprotei archaeon]